jgi:hypothetical protein
VPLFLQFHLFPFESLSIKEERQPRADYYC